MPDDRPAYRPRRAFIEDEPTPERTDTDETSSGTAPAQAPAAPGGPTPQAPGSAPTAGPGALFAEDEARPLFREAAADADAATVRPPSGATSTAGTGTAGASTAGTGTTGTTGTAASGTGSTEAAAPFTTRRLNFAPRPPQPVADEDSTTLLPRTTGRRGDDPRPGDVEDDDLVERPGRLGRRTRIALLVAAVAAVVAIGLVIGNAVIGAQSGTGASGGPGTSTGVASATPSAAPLLDDTSMLSPEGARGIDTARTWSAGETVRGAIPDGGGPGCLGSDPVEGAPTAQQTFVRTLTASGSGAPAALHVAQAYASVEDATQAYAATARALGTCSLTGDWLPTARVVGGVGDEATAVAVDSLAEGRTTRHWVTMSRTGRALDVVDASTPGTTGLDVAAVTRSLASVVGAQCAAAGGACATTVSVTDGPPPAGGDQPGFLTTGDLPPVGSTTAPWVGTPVEAPADDFSGSQCETVTWATTAATTKSSRVYLLQDVPGIFGLNEIVLGVKDAGTATALVDKIRGDWASCKERKLTATVATPAKVSGVAAGNAAIAGWTTEVQQKTGSTTTRFRVGIASSGSTVAFVFLNPQQGLDVSPNAWSTIAVRAVQRATQQG